MKALTLACIFLVSTGFGLGVLADSAAVSSSTASGPSYSTAETPIGELLDDPRARAILDKYLPGFSTADQIDTARGMTLKDVQQYSPDTITDDALAKIDNDLAKLASEKK